MHIEAQNGQPTFFVPPHQAEDVMLAQSETIDWGIKLVGLPDFWKQTKGKGVKVAVLDTGIAHQHSDLRDAVDAMEDCSGSKSGPSDQNGHGTHCAGTIAARMNSSGVIGAAPESRLYILKVLGDDGAGKTSYIADGIKKAIDWGVDIISMSLSCPAYPPELQEMIEAADAANIFIIGAAGNYGPRLDTMGYPAKAKEVISVGAYDRRMKVTNFSSRSASKDDVLDILAPGDGIISTYPPNGFKRLSGTSMACPLVSGVVALMLAKHQIYGGKTDLKTAEDLREHLRETAIDKGPQGWDEEYGAGLIDPSKLLEYHNVTTEEVEKPCPHCGK